MQTHRRKVVQYKDRLDSAPIRLDRFIVVSPIDPRNPAIGDGELRTI